MVTLRAADLPKDPYWVIARNPWSRGKLAIYRRKLGKPPADDIVIRHPPPWSRHRDYLNAASRYQLEAMLTFGEIAHETAGRPLIERMIEIQRRMKNKTFGRTPKPKVLKLELIRQLLQGTRPPRPVVMAAPAAAGEGGAPSPEEVV